MSNRNLNYTDLLGKPFLLGSRGPDQYDCWGICLEIGKRVGINYPEHFTPVETDNQDKCIRETQDSDFIKLKNPEPYCIVTFKITPPFVDHCGVVLKDCLHFIHIMRNHSVVVQRLDNRILVPRMEGFYRLK
ncbi:C40 family peptidase [Candidatus Pacearchaeota archaeon]|nr:C40 family peptidase [Candidatus Pacearchaeota archaeon]